MAFKFLIQDDSGKILTEDGEPVLNCDSDTVANAAIDFLAAVFGEDLKQLVSDFNEIHGMIETEREESNKTVREANEFIKRHKKLAEDYNSLLSVSNRQQEQIRELQKENTKLKTDLQKQQKSVTMKDSDMDRVKTLLATSKRKNEEIRAQNNKLLNDVAQVKRKIEQKKRDICNCVKLFSAINDHVLNTAKWYLKKVYINGSSEDYVNVYSRGFRPESKQEMAADNLKIDVACNYYVEADFGFTVVRFIRGSKPGTLLYNEDIPVPPEVMEEVRERFKTPVIVFDTTIGGDVFTETLGTFLETLSKCSD